MDTPLLPGRPPARCLCCNHLVPTGRLYGPGLGEKCARRRGILPPVAPKPVSAPQTGPSLLEWQTELAAENSDQEHETDHA